MICMIGLGVNNPGGMPVKAFVQSDFVTAFSAVTNIVFAFGRLSLSTVHPLPCIVLTTNPNSSTRRLLRYHG